MNNRTIALTSMFLLGVVAGMALYDARPRGDAAAGEPPPNQAPIQPSVAAPPAAADRRDETPVGPRWWPSRWGASDQRGAANHMSDQRTLAAARLIERGQVFQLGRVYEKGMPTFPHRSFSLTIPAFKQVNGENMQFGRDEMFAGEIGQMGTQLDGLGHVGCRLPSGDTFYNGFTSADIEDAYGLTKLGIENVGVFFTRGVLVDVVGYKRQERLEVGYEITPGDFRGAMQAQGVTIHPGDAVFVRTGHGRLWMQDNDEFNSGEPGIGLDVAQWLITQDICLVGADNWGIEVDPAPNPRRKIEVHQWMLMKHGIYFLENLNLDELAAAGVHEFAFVFAPLKLKGATGSPGNPIAVR